MPKLRVERLRPDVPFPVQATFGSAGFDVHAFWNRIDDLKWYGASDIEGPPRTRSMWLSEMQAVMKATMDHVHANAQWPVFQNSGFIEPLKIERSAYIAKEPDAVYLYPGARILVPTGLRLQIPEGWEVQVRPRSGLAWKHGITVVNSPGTIDADYRGEIKVILHNTGSETFTLKKGDRIAQLVMSPIFLVRFEEGVVDEDTERGSGGFGSTGS